VSTTRRGQPGGSLEQLAAFVIGRVGERRLEQLAHDDERELALELRSAPTQHVHPLALRGGGRGRQHRGLADPGRSLHHQQRPETVARAGQRLLDPGQLVVAFEQRTDLGCRRHVRSLCGRAPKGQGGEERYSPACAASSTAASSIQPENGVR